jgi:pimeloyl-ACP methyl ester carboxylesterase
MRLHPVVAIVASALLAAAPAPAARAQGATTPARPATFVIVHGAWGGGWDWRAAAQALTKAGHTVHRVTLTGLGERVHLASPSIGLATHVADVVNTLRFEELTDVILVGHSYGGMVISGVVDQVPERVRRLVYVDAFLPDSGESVATITGAMGAGLLAAAKDGMIPPFGNPGGTKVPGDVPHPLKTFTDTLHLVQPARRRVPATYILTVDAGQTEDPVFSRFVPRAKGRGYDVITMTADHTPERSALPELTGHLLRAAAAPEGKR